MLLKLRYTDSTTQRKKCKMDLMFFSSVPAGQGNLNRLSKLSFVFVLMTLIPDLPHCPVNTWNHKRRQRGGILMEHSDKPRVTDCLFLGLLVLPPLPFPLLAPPDRVGPNSRWCRRGARTWDLEISVPLTSALDKR